MQAPASGEPCRLVPPVTNGYRAAPLTGTIGSNGNDGAEWHESYSVNRSGFGRDAHSGRLSAHRGVNRHAEMQMEQKETGCPSSRNGRS
ncbi:hypothetical protein GCM10010297_30430 [Streptomyces malachitofuscus]|nr:hypothetical protein GCM10010297_30430 [Streptomyces malachitofuscus]